MMKKTMVITVIKCQKKEEDLQWGQLKAIKQITLNFSHNLIILKKQNKKWVNLKA